MGLYRRLARSKRGMSTIFGGLFFVILILMGFNLMLWGFIQQDAYNSVIAQMNQGDQAAISENLIPQNPGASNFVNGSSPTFQILLNNLGGSSVSLVRIYITNVTSSISATVNCGPCIVNPAPQTGYSFTNANIPVGCIYTSPTCKVTVSGIGFLNDGRAYKVVLASGRGRLFSFFYPWPVSTVQPNTNIFSTNIGPLSIFFDFASFQFTKDAQTIPTGAWVMPTNQPVVIWVKVSNVDPNYDIKLRVESSLLFQSYSAGGIGASTPFFIVGPNSVYPGPPTNVTAYNQSTNPYILPHATSSGPGPAQWVKFAAATQGSNTLQKFPNSDNTWIVFIGFFYNYNGNLLGQTIPFVAAKTCVAYPAASCYA